MYLSLCLYLSLSLFLSSCWSGHVSSSLSSNVSKVIRLWDQSYRVFSKCICHCVCIPHRLLSLSLSFCWSGHVSSSPSSHVSRVTSLWECCMLVFFNNVWSWVSESVKRSPTLTELYWGQLKMQKKYQARKYDDVWRQQWPLTMYECCNNPRAKTRQTNQKRNNYDLWDVGLIIGTDCKSLIICVSEAMPRRRSKITYSACSAFQWGRRSSPRQFPKK